MRLHDGDAGGVFLELCENIEKLLRRAHLSVLCAKGFRQLGDAHPMRRPKRLLEGGAQGLAALLEHLEDAAAVVI